jgi:hypothetical protein
MGASAPTRCRSESSGSRGAGPSHPAVGVQVRVDPLLSGRVRAVPTRSTDTAADAAPIRASGWRSALATRTAARPHVHACPAPGAHAAHRLAPARRFGVSQQRRRSSRAGRRGAWGPSPGFRQRRQGRLRPLWLPYARITPRGRPHPVLHRSRSGPAPTAAAPPPQPALRGGGGRQPTGSARGPWRRRCRRC